MELQQTRPTEAAAIVEALNASRDPKPVDRREGAGPLTVLFLKKRLEAMRFAMLDLRADNERLRAEAKEAYARRDHLAEHVANIYASRGWRVVMALRSLRDLYRWLAAPFRPARHP